MMLLTDEQRSLREALEDRGDPWVRIRGLIQKVLARSVGARPTMMPSNYDDRKRAFRTTRVYIPCSTCVSYLK